MTRAPRAALPVLLVALLAFAGLGVVRAVTGGGTPTTQERVNALSAAIRCPTCQGLSIKDSPSVLADGSRQIVEEQIRAGRTDAQVQQYFVDRYGAFVLLRPDPAGPGLLVWLLPALAVPVGGVLMYRWLRRGKATAPATGAGAPVASNVEADGDAAAALTAYRTGLLAPDDSPAGEALREALHVRVAADVDGLDAAEVQRVDLRLGAAARRYAARERRPSRPVTSGRSLPRRTVTGLSVGMLVLGAGAALAFGVRERGSTDLPTGDLPGGASAAASAPAAPGLSELQAATRSRPDDPTTWIALGRAEEAGQAFGRALAAYDQALRLRPSDDVRLLRAGLLLRAGSSTEALQAVEPLAQRYPDDPDTVLLLGLAQEQTGAAGAKETLRRFLELAPDEPGAAAVRELLARR